MTHKKMKPNLSSIFLWSLSLVFIGVLILSGTAFAQSEISYSTDQTSYLLAQNENNEEENGNENEEDNGNESDNEEEEENENTESGDSSSGGGAQYCSYTAFPGAGQVCDLCSLGQALWGLMFIILFLGVLGSFVYAGYLYLTSAANAGSVNQANTIMTNAVIGLVIGLSSYIILQTLNPNLLSGNCGLNPAPSTSVDEGSRSRGGGDYDGSLDPIEECEASNTDTTDPAECLLSLAEDGEIELSPGARQNIANSTGGSGGVIDSNVLHAMVRIVQDAGFSYRAGSMKRSGPAGESYHNVGRAVDFTHANGEWIHPTNQAGQQEGASIREACVGSGAVETFGPDKSVKPGQDDHNDHTHCAF